MTKRDCRTELFECGTAISISYVDTENVQIQEEMPMLDIPKSEDIMQTYQYYFGRLKFSGIWMICHWVSSSLNFEGL